MLDGGVHRRPAFEPAPLHLDQRLDAAPVNDLQTWIGLIDLLAPKPEVHHYLLRSHLKVLQQNDALLHVRGQDVPIIGVARKVPGGPLAKPSLVRDSNAHLHAKLVGLSRLSFCAALDLGRVQRVELFLIVALLGADALGALQLGIQ